MKIFCFPFTFLLGSLISHLRVQVMWMKRERRSRVPGELAYPLLPLMSGAPHLMGLFLKNPAHETVFFPKPVPLGRPSVALTPRPGGATPPPPGSFVSRSHSFIICTVPPAWRPLAFKADVRGVQGLCKAAEGPAWPLLTSGCHPGISHTAPRVPKSWGTSPLLQLPRSFVGGGRSRRNRPVTRPRRGNLTAMSSTARPPPRHCEKITLHKAPRQGV